MDIIGHEGLKLNDANKSKSIHEIGGSNSKRQSLDLKGVFAMRFYRKGKSKTKFNNRCLELSFWLQ